MTSVTKMEELSTPFEFQPKKAFGLRTEVLRNIHLDGGTTLIHTISNTLAFTNVRTRDQKFLYFEQDVQPLIVATNPDRRLVVVAEKGPARTDLRIYEISSLACQQTINLNLAFNNKIFDVSFTHDSSKIAVLSNEPVAFLSIYDLAEATPVSIRRVSSSISTGSASLLSCHPTLSSVFAVGGESLLKIVTKTEKSFLTRTINVERFYVTSLIWLTDEVLVAGTSKSQLLFAKNAHLMAVCSASSLETFDLDDLEQKNEVPQEGKAEVRGLTRFQKGLAFALGNTVHVFKKESNLRFSKRSLITIPVTLWDPETYQIQNLAINAKEDSVLATTRHSQVYIARLFEPDTPGTAQISFQTCGEQLHTDTITCLAVCSWKSTVLTASTDLTVRIWNYETAKIELVVRYQSEITALAMHPTGMLVVLGFSDSVRLMMIQMTSFKTLHIFPIFDCSILEFCHSGHLFAAVSRASISVIGVVEFSVLWTVERHEGGVNAIAWAPDDSEVVSAGREGGIRVWEALSGEETMDVSDPGNEYEFLGLPTEGNTIFGVTKSGFLREIRKSEVPISLKLPNSSPVTSFAVARASQKLFFGHEDGELYSFSYPFGKTTLPTKASRFFHKAVSCLKVSPEEKFLISASKDGTLVIWELFNTGIMNSLVLESFDSLMLDRADVVSKNNTIAELQATLRQQAEEFRETISKGQGKISNKIADVQREYEEQIEGLKKQCEEARDSLENDLQTFRSKIEQTRVDSAVKNSELKANLDARLAIERAKVASAQQESEEMKEDFEEKIKQMLQQSQEVQKEMEEDFKERISERERLIEQLMKDIEEQKTEFKSFFESKEEEKDRRTVECRVKFETLLKDAGERTKELEKEAAGLEARFSEALERENRLEREQKEALRELAVLREKAESLPREIERLQEEVEENPKLIAKNEAIHESLLRRNSELKKFCQTLEFKATELRAEMEPLESQIQESKARVADVIAEVGAVNQMKEQAKFSVMKTKELLAGIESELREEERVFRTTKTKLGEMTAELKVLQSLKEQPSKLKSAVLSFSHKYLHPNCHSEAEKSTAEKLMAKRELVERVAGAVTKNQEEDGAAVDLLRAENGELKEKIEKIRSDWEFWRGECERIKKVVGGSVEGMDSQTARRKLAEAVERTERREQQKQDEIKMLEMEIRELEKKQ